MRKNTTLLLSTAVIAASLLVTAAVIGAVPNQALAVQHEGQDEAEPPVAPLEIMSETVELGGMKLGPNEIAVLGFVTPTHDSKLQNLMVAANLPCADGKSDNIAANDAPAVKIVLYPGDNDNLNNQVAIPVISNAKQDAGLMAADGMCAYHVDTDDTSQYPDGQYIIVAINDGDKAVDLPQGAGVSWVGAVSPVV